MVDFADILRNSEDGQALDRLAAEFGISRDEADAAVQALVPDLSSGLVREASDPQRFASLMGASGEGRPVAALSDPSLTASIPEAEREAIVARAAAATGLAPSLLSKMLPVIASMVLSAVIKAVQSKGLPAILSALVKVAGVGGLGAILGQILGGGRGEASPHPPRGSPSAPEGGIDLGTILEQVLRGGRAEASPVPPQGSPSSPGSGIDLGTILEQVLRGGKESGQPQPQQGSPSAPDSGSGIDLGTILEQILGGGHDRAGSASPGEPERPRGGLEDEIGQILRGDRR